MPRANLVRMEADLSAPDSAERRLWAVCMNDALRLALGEDRDTERLNELRQKRGLRINARKWFASHALYIGSFEFCCLALDLDPQAARMRIARMIDARSEQQRIYRQRWQKKVSATVSVNTLPKKTPTVFARFYAVPPNGLWTGIKCGHTKPRSQFYDTNPYTCRVCQVRAQRMKRARESANG